MSSETVCTKNRMNPTVSTALNGQDGGSQLLSTIFSPVFQANWVHFMPEWIRMY